MSKLAEFIKHEHDVHLKILQETPEDAHTHSLWVSRMERAQQYLYEHVPDNPTRKKMIGHLHELRQMIGKALERRE